MPLNKSEMDDLKNRVNDLVGGWKKEKLCGQYVNVSKYDDEDKFSKEEPFEDDTYFMVDQFIEAPYTFNGNFNEYFGHLEYTIANFLKQFSKEMAIYLIKRMDANNSEGELNYVELSVKMTTRTIKPGE